MPIKTAGTPANVTGSIAFTSQSEVEINRVNAVAPASPMTTPLAITITA